MSTFISPVSPRDRAFSLPGLRRRLRSSCGVAALALAGLGAFAAPASAACPTTPDATNTLVVDSSCATINLGSFPAGTNLLVTPTGSMTGNVSVGGSAGNITINGSVPGLTNFFAGSTGKITIGSSGSLTSDVPLYIFPAGSLTLNGGIENNGSIIGSSRAVYLRNVDRVIGSVVNNGTVRSSFLTFDIRVINGVSGDFVNNGTIESTGSGSPTANGMSTSSAIAGSVVNTGNVTGAGGQSGIDIAGTSASASDVRNSSTGRITNFLTGVNIGGATIRGGLINAGLIDAQTTGVTIANVSGATTIANGVTNSGTINGGTTGISVAGTSRVPTINNLVGGVISGGTNSIRLAQTSAPTTVNNWGELRGAVDLGAFNTLNLNGNAARVVGATTGGAASVVNVNGTFASEGAFTAGAFNVTSGGVFNMNNTITAPVTVAGGGQLNLLSAQTIDGSIANNGAVNVGANLLTVTGAYTQTAGASFRTAINYIGAGGYGQMQSAQALNVADGAVILAAFASSEKYANGTVIQDVLKGVGAPTKAGKITLFAQNQLNIPRYQWSAVWDGTNVDLVLSRYDGALVAPTLQTVNQNRNAVLGVMHQRFALLNAVMEYDCAQFDKYGFCLSVQARATGFGMQSTGAGVFNMAYRAADKFRIGGFVDYQATYNSALVGGYTPESVHAYDNRPTFGGYAGFSETGYTSAPLQKGMQLLVSGGVNHGRVAVTRAMLSDAMGYLDAQPGSGTARLDAYYVRGVAGYGIDVVDRLRVMPYVGLRYTDVTRGGYVEGVNALVTQPLAYEAFYERLITGFGGAQVAAMLTPAMGVRAGLGAEVDFKRSANNYSGVSQIPGLAVFSLAHGGAWNGARPAANGGLFYNITPNQRVFLNGATGQQAYTTRGYASGMLGYQAAF